MKKALIYCCLIFMLSCLTSVAFADYYSQQFGDMDLSRDDFVDFAEFRYYVSGATQQAFNKIDTNQDEKIDFFEWVAFQEKDYPFKSKSNFKYKGKSGNWYVDHHGNRYKVKDGYCHRYLQDCCFNYPYDGWYRPYYGMYWGHCHSCMRGALTVGVGITH